jgi:nitrogen fixation/metabolism regulation signal transduction histidine kinase
VKKLCQESIADFSYQVRNQLTFIMLSSETLHHDLKNVISEEQREEFRKIDVAAKEIKQLLEKFVNLTLDEITEPRIKEEELASLIGG